mgnify:CR=1 FL=1
MIGQLWQAGKLLIVQGMAVISKQMERAMASMNLEQV